MSTLHAFTTDSLTRLRHGKAVVEKALADSIACHNETSFMSKRSLVLKLGSKIFDVAALGRVEDFNSKR
jgi:hypothetical protein